MKTAATALLILSLGLPATAQEAAPPPTTEAPSLMEQGAKLLFEGLMKEMEPALGDMGQALDELRPMVEAWGPQLKELTRLIGDFQNYDAPVVLPNGDILIRRKPEAPSKVGPELPGPNGDIEL